MVDPRSSYSRRRLLRAALGGVSVVALSGGSALTLGHAFAKDGDDDKGEDDDDDHGGKDGKGGHGGDDLGGSGGSDHSGHGGGGDDGDDDHDDAVTVTGDIPAGSIQVTIGDDDANGFSPRELTVDLGQQVTFVNAHDDPHTATGSGFDTGIMQPGQTATVTLDRPGRFAYACQIHPEMTGSIAVRDETGEVPSAAQASPTADGPTTSVRIVNFAFDPGRIAIETGTTVVWTNDDSVPHTATALDGAFDSGIFDPGDSFSWRFTAPGTFDYRCDLHPNMTGTIEVSGDPLPANAASTPEATAAATPEPALTPLATPEATPGTPVAVTITNFLFDPESVTVPAGTTIFWTNQDAVPHTATALDASFDTGRLDQGQSGSVTFDAPGSFDYRCSFHPSMLGKVIVT